MDFLYHNSIFEYAYHLSVYTIKYLYYILSS